MKNKSFVACRYAAYALLVAATGYFCTTIWYPYAIGSVAGFLAGWHFAVKEM